MRPESLWDDERIGVPETKQEGGQDIIFQGRRV